MTQGSQRTEELSDVDQVRIRTKNVQQALIENMKSAVLASGYIYDASQASHVYDTEYLDHAFHVSPYSNEAERWKNYVNDKGDSLTSGLSKVFPYLGEPELLLSLLTNPKDATELTNATPAQLSLLEPMLEFAIVDKDDNEEIIHFSQYTSEENLVELASLRAARGSRLLKSRRHEGTDVGVKKFSWTYNNKHEGDYIIEAELQLYFGSLSELVNEKYLSFLYLNGEPIPYAKSLEPKDSGQTDQQRISRILDGQVACLDAAPWNQGLLSDLLPGEGWRLRGGWGKRNTTAYSIADHEDYFKACEALAEESSSRRKNFRRLRVTAGWSVPKGNQEQLLSLFAGGDRGNRTRMNKFLKGVSLTQKTIFLNLADYDVDFSQDGTTTLSMTFFGSADVYTNSNQADVLGPRRGKEWEMEVPVDEPAQYGLDPKSIMPGYLSYQLKFPQHAGSPLPHPYRGGVIDLVAEAGVVNPAAGPSTLTMANYYPAAHEYDNPPLAYLSLRGIEADYEYYKKELQYRQLLDANNILSNQTEQIERIQKTLDQLTIASRVVKKLTSPMRYNKLLNMLIDGGKVFTARAETQMATKSTTSGLAGHQTTLHFVPWDSPTVDIGKSLDAQRERLKAYSKAYSIIREKPKDPKQKVLPKFALDKNQLRKIWSNSFDSTTTYSDTGVDGYTMRYDVFYVRLGDVLKAAIGLAELNDRQVNFLLGSFAPTQAQIKGFDETKPTPSVRQRQKTQNAFLSSQGASAGKLYLEEYMMLYDIPIAVDYLNQWVLENAVEKQRTSWPFRQFLQSLLDMVTKLLNFVTDAKSKLSIQYTSEVLTGYTPNFRGIDIYEPDDPNYTGIYIFREHHLRPTADFVPVLTRYDQGAIKSSRDKFAPDPKYSEPWYEQQFKPVEYYIITARQMGTARRMGDRTYDEADGIYHYVLGAERGIAKSFNFSKQEIPYYREMQLEDLNRTGQSKALVLPQNIDLEMFGNSLHKNGDYIYIDSRALLGHYGNKVLGLGGYYGVYQSINQITAQGYTTTVKALYQYMGD